MFPANVEGKRASGGFSTRSKAMIEATKAIELLKRQMQQGVEHLRHDSPEVDRWWSVTERVVEEAFGRNSTNYSHFVCTVSYGETWQERQESFVNTIQSKKGLLGVRRRIDTFSN